MADCMSACDKVHTMTQDEALEILKTGANVFLTGEPGSGKTHTVNAYVRYLREHMIEPAITASTGIASTHIGGMTIHAWSGIGVRTEITEYDIDHIMQNERTVKRIKKAHVLIIDEISMLSARTLSMVEAVCRHVRDASHPFGGLQVILVGDFFQLPPIVGRDNRFEEPTLDMEGASDSLGGFAYQSSAWRKLNPIVCYLEEQHRQEDPAFLAILAGMRGGTVTALHRSTLSARRVKGPLPAEITQLFSHNADVDRINDEALARVNSPAKHFIMQTHGSAALITPLVRTCLSPQDLALKVGARVMFTKNDPQGSYVNGTTGTVVGFRADSYPLVETTSGALIGVEPVDWSLESEGRVLASITQIPLRLAWAITVHKSQGMSLDAAIMDLSRAFEYGQGYVALSRVRTLAGLHLIGINERALEVHPDVREQDGDFRARSETAEDTFAGMDPTELHALQTAFIRACGGSAEARAIVRGQPAAPKKSTYEETRELVPLHTDIKAIAATRGVSENTIFAHLEELRRTGALTRADIERLAGTLDHKSRTAIHEAIGAVGPEKLRPIYDRLGERYPFEMIRLARLLFEIPKE